MIINPKYEKKVNGSYIFGFRTQCTANKALCKSIFQELWKGFCCTVGEIEFACVDDLAIKIGQVETLKKPENGYVMEITEQGVSISASDVKNLIYGFFALLERITPVSTKKGEERFSVDCCKVKDEACVKIRMAHLCVFPETDLAFIRKFIRAAAFLRYTHLIIEFWGTLQFDCLKELAWEECSYSKDEIRPLLQEARDLGMELVPMFNLWGHASGCRVKTGKHVVLDQNLALAPLFSDSGWEWNLSNSETIKLQEKICEELIELFGEGEYFHIGCDEAYSAKTNEEFEAVVDYINVASERLQKKGRKTIMWGDMLLHVDTLNRKLIENRYYISCPNIELQEILLNKLPRSIIIGDWQYNAQKYPIETTLFFKEKGFEVLCCPWDLSKDNVVLSAEMIKKHNLLGVMHTTWQSIRSDNGIWELINSAALCWGDEEVKRKWVLLCSFASIIRKLNFTCNGYENAGWEKKQILD